MLKLEPDGTNNFFNAVSLNARFPIYVKAAPFSTHSTDSKLVHFSKALFPIVIIFEGIVIDFKEIHP